ncbi:MAG: UPF0153 protein YeiW [Candidatus Burkholderia crenata]|nr:MAG: UPF0153 protein YeiW [Candidatus Burkholderia crenata]
MEVERKIRRCRSRVRCRPMVMGRIEGVCELNGGWVRRVARIGCVGADRGGRGTLWTNVDKLEEDVPSLADTFPRFLRDNAAAAEWHNIGLPRASNVPEQAKQPKQPEPMSTAQDPNFAHTCRESCGASCIAPSISSAVPGMPDGKPAGVRCVQLRSDLRSLCDFRRSALAGLLFGLAAIGVHVRRHADLRAGLAHATRNRYAT